MLGSSPGVVTTSLRGEAGQSSHKPRCRALNGRPSPNHGAHPHTIPDFEFPVPEAPTAGVSTYGHPRWAARGHGMGEAPLCLSDAGGRISLGLEKTIHKKGKGIC